MHQLSSATVDSIGLAAINTSHCVYMYVTHIHSNNNKKKNGLDWKSSLTEFLRLFRGEVDAVCALVRRFFWRSSARNVWSAKWALMLEQDNQTKKTACHAQAPPRHTGRCRGAPGTASACPLKEKAESNSQTPKSAVLFPRLA